MIKLRKYQQKLVDDARQSLADGNKSVLLVAPTGGGKTIMLSYICKKAVLKGKRVLIIAHRQELLEQISGALTQFKIKHGFIAAGLNENNDSVQVASAQTLVRRLAKAPAFDLIIIDEAHHAAKGNTWFKCLEHYKRSTKLGVTATPCRLSGEPLKQIFSDMVLGPSTRCLITDGFLSSYRYFAPPSNLDLSGVRRLGGDYNKKDLEEKVKKTRVIGDVVSHYKKLVDGKRAVAFCVTVAHATLVTNAFIDEGISSAVLHANLAKHVRKNLVENFRDGKILVLTNVGIVSEGFDLPAIDAVLLLRPTQSLSLFLQQVGRSLRTYPGKKFAYIIDHVNNLGRHGMPCDDREWSLESSLEVPPQKKLEQMMSIKTCAKCLAVNLSTNQSCAYCGTEFKTKKDVIEVTDDELTEILDREQAKKDKLEAEQKLESEKRNISKARTREALEEIQRKMNYKPGWVYQRISWLKSKGLFRDD